MKISTKGRYALRLLVDLAEHQGSGYVALGDVARRQGISKKYLEQIIPMLNGSDLIRTNRGAKGGYMLAKDPAECTVGDILRLTEGSLVPVTCLETDPVDCPRVDDCPTLFIWKGLSELVNDYLDNITLRDILDKNGFNADNYVI